MTSVGNDIVALDTIDVQRTILPNFYSKIITGAELAFYEPAVLPFHQYVWLLWSVKEAAYKYMARLKPGLVFSPTRTVVNQICIPALAGNDDDSPTDGYITAQVTFEEYQLQTCSIITGKYIASFAHTIPFANVHWGIKYITDPHPDNQSAVVRQFAMQELQQLYSDSSITIDKTPHGVPVVLLNGSDAGIALSFSHHSHYIGYAFVVG